MAVSNEVRRLLFQRALGRCECISDGCDHHLGRCNEVLRRNWHAHHRTADGPDALSNLVAMCETCYANAQKLRHACLNGAHRN